MEEQITPLTKEQAKFILQHNFTPCDFVYNDDHSPLDNILNAIELAKEIRYNDGYQDGSFNASFLNN
jgi:hypothetical protein